jgi:mono/diheme cytochrome c family protein
MRELWARNIVILTGVLVILLAMVFAALQNSPEPLPVSPQQATVREALVMPGKDNQAVLAAGRSVFESQGCMGCHSIAGEGNPRYPLDGVGQRHSAEAIRQWILAPVELEGQFSTRAFQAKQVYRALPAEDIDAVVGYLQNLR